MSTLSKALGVLGVGGWLLCMAGCMSDRVLDEADLDRLLKEFNTEVQANKAAPAQPQAQAAKPATALAGAALPVTEEPLAAPVAAAAQSAGALTIQSDCLVQVTVEEDASLNGTYPVNDIGAIDLGYVGPVILYNKTETDAAAKIRDILTSRHFRNATVQVKIIRASYDKVRVAGAVLSPGLVKIGAGDAISLNDALLRAGGLLPSATGARVKIVRGGLTSAVALAAQGESYSLVDAGGQPSVPDVRLANNDIAYVYSGEPTAAVAVGQKAVLVLGELKTPGLYRFADTEPCTLMHLLFKVGDQVSPYANKKGVRIIRTKPDGKTEEFRVNAEKLLSDGDFNSDVALENGDRIIIPSRKMTLF